MNDFFNSLSRADPKRIHGLRNIYPKIMLSGSIRSGEFLFGLIDCQDQVGPVVLWICKTVCGLPGGGARWEDVESMLVSWSDPGDEVRQVGCSVDPICVSAGIAGPGEDELSIVLDNRHVDAPWESVSVFQVIPVRETDVSLVCIIEG